GDLQGNEGYLRSRLQADDSQAVLLLEALAHGYLRVNRLNEAIRFLDQLLRREPNNVIALVDRGTVHEGIGLADKALEDYQAASAVQPDYKPARLCQGQLLLHLNRPAEALPHFEHLHARDSRKGETTLGLAQCERDLGRDEEAAALLDALLAEEPVNGKALLARGRLALDADDPAAAEEWLRRGGGPPPGSQHAQQHPWSLPGARGQEARAAPPRPA